MNNELMLGVDIGGTNTKFGFVQHDGIVIERTSIDTNADKGAQDLIERLYNYTTKWLKKNSGYRLKGVGIGAPNANYYTGKVENPPNLGWGDVYLVEMVQDKFGLPVRITNDANASALGEMLFGAARGMKDFIVITLGTGLGSGIVINGQLVYGANGYAGELGHTVVDPQGRRCATGRIGCLESYASATGIVRTAMEMMARCSEPSALREMPHKDITAHKIYSLAKKGDKIALDCFDYTAKILGLSLANFVMFSAPEAIFICGGLADAADLLFDAVKEEMEKHLISNFQNQVKILPSGITENPAILGAAALAWKDLANMGK